MRTLWKAAAVLVALGAAACSSQAQTYDDRYYGNDSASGYPGGSGYYDDGYYGDGYYDDGYDSPYAGAEYGQDAYGYCDEYGCPGDYWNLPVYYGSIFYDDAWINGPLYYRDWGGRRQYWVRGGWRYDAWRGARPDRYRDARYGPALGLSWYRSNHVYRQGWHGGGSYRGNIYRAPRVDTHGPGRGIRNSFSNRNENGFRSGANGRSRWGDRSAYRGSRSGGSQSGYSGSRQGGQGRSGMQSRGSGGGGHFGGGSGNGGHGSGRHR
jgi:hypothetical protein